MAGSHTPFNHLHQTVRDGAAVVADGDVHFVTSPHCVAGSRPARSRSIRRLTRHSVFKAELVRVVLHVRRVLVIVEQELRVRHTHEEPRQALELAEVIRRLASGSSCSPG